MSSCLIATFKNEAPYLLEWVSHHLAVGFDEIVIATNDCDDGTDEMLDLLEAGGFVTHIRNPGPYALSIQGDAYQAARATPQAQACDWLMCLDADEFLNIHVGAHRVDDLLGSFDENTDAILVCWRLFGDSGRSGSLDMPVTAAFTQAQSAQTKRWPVKTLFRDDPDYLEIRPHAPWSNPKKMTLKPKDVFTTAGIKQPPSIFNEEQPFRVPRWRHRSWELAQVNHYLCKTKELFSEKILKGTSWPNKFSQQRLSYDFFDKMNMNDETDRSILAVEGRRKAVEDQMRAIPKVAELSDISQQQLAKRVEQLSEA